MLPASTMPPGPILRRRRKKLDLAQASMLAGLVQAPTYYNPLQNYPAAKARQKIVLTLMTEQGYISPEQSNDAYKKDLGLQR